MTEREIELTELLAETSAALEAAVVAKEEAEARAEAQAEAEADGELETEPEPQAEAEAEAEAPTAGDAVDAAMLQRQPVRTQPSLASRS